MIFLTDGSGVGSSYEIYLESRPSEANVCFLCGHPPPGPDIRNAHGYTTTDSHDQARNIREVKSDGKSAHLRNFYPIVPLGH